MEENYKKLYFHLAGRIADIIDSIDLMRDPPEKVLRYVRGWLVDAMQEGEELYLQEPEDDSPPAADFQRIL